MSNSFEESAFFRAADYKLALEKEAAHPALIGALIGAPAGALIAGRAASRGDLELAEKYRAAIKKVHGNKLSKMDKARLKKATELKTSPGAAALAGAVFGGLSGAAAGRGLSRAKKLLKG